MADLHPVPAVHRGFILQPTYRIEAGRPVVHLYGCLEGGGSFLVRDGRTVPHFYVAAGDAGHARVLGAAAVESTRRVTLGGEVVARVEVPTPPDTPPLRDRLLAAGVDCYEADVRFAVRYLIDRGIRGALEIHGRWRQVPGVGRVFVDPEVAPASFAPVLSVLSLDIETDPHGRRLLSVALHGCGAAEVLLLTPEGASCPAGATPCASERALVAALVERVRRLDPDVLTGWNVAGFDLAVLDRVARRVGVPLELGRGPGGVRVRADRPARGRGGMAEATLPGRVVLDGVALLRGAFLRMESYALDAVAREVLGEGKTLAAHGRAEEIERLFRDDRERFVAYNLNDARLVTDILAKLQLVELAVARSLLTGMPPDRVAGSIACFDFLYLSELAKRGVVAPSVARPRPAAPPRRPAGVHPFDADAEGEEEGGDERAGEEAAAEAESEDEPEAEEVLGGGHVLEPQPGLYDLVLVFDFKSLYPSLIRTFQIDPLGYLPDPAAAAAGDDPEPDPIVAPNGAAFRRRPGVLTLLLDRLFPAREAARQAGDRTASYAIKILMNSFYGVLGTSACRFYNPQIANAITSFGRELLLWSKDWFEARGHPVLYGDTDSLFFDSRAGAGGDGAEVRRRGEALATDLNRALAAHVAATWRVTSRLELVFDRLYRKLFLPPMRHSTAGARKRYAGLLDEPAAGGGSESAGGDRDGESTGNDSAAGEPGAGRVVFTGMEVVRRDWTELARRVQRELYERLFRERPLEEYLRGVVADLRAGRLDDLLVYKKSLRKPPAAYTATTPPHVAAARKLPPRPAGRPPRRVSYVITTAGPEPVVEGTPPPAPIDYQHYVDKQVRPVAEPVLALLGLDFAQVIGDDRQMSLF
jgi:DNA polymerase II